MSVAAFRAPPLAFLLLSCAVRCAPAAPSAAPTAHPTHVEVSAAPEPKAKAPAPPAAYLDAPGPSALARLPRGGAIYVAVHLDMLRRLPDAVVRSLLGEDMPSVFALSESVHVDPRRAVLGAVLSTHESDARPVVDAIAAGVSGKALERVLAQHRGEAMLFRVVVPLETGTDAVLAARVLGKAVAMGAEIESCAEAARCGAFADPKPLGVLVHESRVVAVYAESSSIRLDVAESLFGEGKDAELTQTLARMSALADGPEPERCGAFDASAGAALCVDADGAAALGTTIGYDKLLRALHGADFQPGVVRRIAVQGRSEAQQNLGLAAPSRRLVDDGTLSMRLDRAHLGCVASWRLTDTSRQAVERAFGPEPRCAAGDELVSSLLPHLLDAFGDPGADFKEAETTLHRVEEGGWGAWLVLFARTWPNALGAARARLAEMPLPSLGTACVRTNRGRLEIESTRAIDAAN